MAASSVVGQVQMFEDLGRERVDHPIDELPRERLRSFEGSDSPGLDRDARFSAHIVAVVEDPFDPDNVRQAAGVVNHLFYLLVEAQLGDTGRGLGGYGPGKAVSRWRHGGLTVMVFRPS